MLADLGRQALAEGLAGGVAADCGGRGHEERVAGLPTGTDWMIAPRSLRRMATKSLRGAPAAAGPTQVAKRPRGHGAGRGQPVPAYPCQPDAVGLAPADLPHVPGMEQLDLQAGVLQGLAQCLPEDAGALHGGRGDRPSASGRSQARRRCPCSASVPLRTTLQASSISRRAASARCMLDFVWFQ